VTVCDGRTPVVRELCQNGADDDGDGRTDCADSDCALDGRCLGEANCTDGVDDEGDGLTDCDDGECAGLAVCVDVGPEETLARCMDGADNDMNGFIDCNDFGCSMSMDMAVRDYCASRLENTLERCMDMIDNDMNGFTDCDDFSCSMSMDPDIMDLCGGMMGEPEDTLAECMDGVDNDMNGFVDCNDFSCSRSTMPDIIAYCDSLAEEGIERCTDGIDNDRNGYTDCDDNNCIPANPVTPDERMLRDLCEASFATCTDGSDNEGDGFPDCSDFSCRDTVEYDLGVPLVAQSPCLETGVALDAIADDVVLTWQMLDPGLRSLTEEQIRLRLAERSCSDGTDNDVDGFVDCDDWDCNWHPYLRGFCDGVRGGRLVCE
jgi:Ca2+-binding EF-hand superfamily protein